MGPGSHVDFLFFIAVADHVPDGRIRGLRTETTLSTIDTKSIRGSVVAPIAISILVAIFLLP